MTALPTGALAPKHPSLLQLYTMPTPNGQKASIALEELGLDYEAHRIDIMNGDQHTPEYLRISPNGKIPGLVDPDGPGGEPIAIMESGAILLYLAKEKAGGKLIPSGPGGEWELLQWMLFQVGHVGPMFGQFGHFFHFAKGKTDSYGEERYRKETKRLLGVLDEQVGDKDWLLGTFSLADIMIVPWLEGLSFYKAEEAVELDSFRNVVGWMKRFGERPGVVRGRVVGSAEWAERQDSTQG